MALCGTRDYRRIRPLPKHWIAIPEAGLDNIKAILNYRAEHPFQAQL
jgi:hypothetical protein